MKLHIFAVLLILLEYTTRSEANGSGASCSCRDGKDGKDGRDGRDGRDAPTGLSCRKGDKEYVKPFIHLDGSTTGRHMKHVPNVDIETWSINSPHSHVRGGMTYARGKISVPTSGVYFMYCQVYHHNIRHHSNLSSRQRIFVNGQPLAIGGNHRGNYEGSYYTGLALPLNAGDTISCRLQYEGEIVTYEQHTFMGAYLV